MSALPCATSPRGAATRGRDAPALHPRTHIAARPPAPRPPTPCRRPPAPRRPTRLHATVVPPPGGPPPALRPEGDVPGLAAFLDGLKFGKADGLLVAIAQVRRGGKKREAA